jgi:hypothetical protein
MIPFLSLHLSLAARFLKSRLHPGWHTLVRKREAGPDSGRGAEANCSDFFGDREEVLPDKGKTLFHTDLRHSEF